jgi:hypothetical protein
MPEDNALATTGDDKLPSRKALELKEAVAMFKFYEEAAEKTKVHAWSQTTWILTLNAGIFAFSLAYAGVYEIIWIEVICACVGIVLCGFLIYLLGQLGDHISSYFTSANQLAFDYLALRRFIRPKELSALKANCNHRASFPQFCSRLRLLALGFLFAHIIWAVIAMIVPSNRVISPKATPGVSVNTPAVSTPARQEQAPPNVPSNTPPVSTPGLQGQK